MAEFNNRTMTQGAQAAVIDQGLRAYMLRVYNYMAIGLGITGLAAWGVFGAAFDASGLPNALGVALFASPLKWLVILAPLAMVMLLSFGIHRMSVATAQITFWVYAALVGVSLASLGAIYTGQSITRVFFITAAAFGSLSLWGYTTKRDLTGFGSFLIMGLVGILIASIVNIFLASSGLQFVISVIGVLVFAGLTAYDTQKIKEMYYEADDAAVAGRKAVMGALALYLDFINLFIMLVQLFGQRRS